LPLQSQLPEHPRALKASEQLFISDFYLNRLPSPRGQRPRCAATWLATESPNSSWSAEECQLQANRRTAGLLSAQLGAAPQLLGSDEGPGLLRSYAFVLGAPPLHRF
jgi:hypothetical protein